MTSTLATNAVVDTTLTRKHYLRADKEGRPLDKQVPRTYQVYTGTGSLGEVLDYDGSDELVLFADNLTGPLIVRFGPTISKTRNWLGREMKIQINGQTTQSITLNSSPVFMKLNGTSLTQLSHVIPGDSLSKTITVSFSSDNLWNVDYGASARSLIPIPLQSNSQIVSPKYLAPFVVNISNLARGGVPPYTATPPPFTSGTIDKRFGSIIVNNGAGTVTVYSPSRNFSPVISTPIQITDSAGSTVVSSIQAFQDKITYITGQNYSSTACTHIATVLGVQAIFTKNNTGPSLAIVDDANTITDLAGNQNDNLMFYMTSTSSTQVYYYDPVIGGPPPTGIVPQTGLGFIGAGITNIRCISYNHDTDELFVFGNTVATAIYVVGFDRYQRSTVAPTLTQRQITILTNAINPNTQPILAAIYSDTSYVTGCEFVDGRDMVVLAIWDPVASRSKIVTLNSQMFKNRGTQVGVLPTTYHDQYVIGVYDNAILNNVRIGLSSMKIEDRYGVAFINGTSATVNFIRDLSFFNNTLLADGNYPSILLTGLPTEVRGTRTLINY